MGRNLLRGGALALLALSFLTACNPQNELNLGGINVGTGGTTSSTGLSFPVGTLKVSKAVAKDLYGSMGSQYCMDNTDVAYGCVGANGQVNTAAGLPVLIRRLRFNLYPNSLMYGLTASDALTVAFPAASVTTAIPVPDPTTGNFVMVQRERYGWTQATPGGGFTVSQILTDAEDPCVIGQNGAVGFSDQSGNMLTGIHVLEEGIDYSTAINDLYAANVEVESFSLSVSNNQLVASNTPQSITFGNSGGTLPQCAAPSCRSPNLVNQVCSGGVCTDEVYSNAGTDLPRVITGFCIRSTKTSTAKNIIRVGLFGVRGVFFTGHFL